MIDLRPHNDPKRLMDEAKDWAATCRQQKAELERLRAALNEIVETAKANWYVPELTSPADPYECGFSDGMDRAAEIADAALQGKQ